MNFNSQKKKGSFFIPLFFHFLASFKIFYFIYKNSIFLWCPGKIFLSCILIFGHVWKNNVFGSSLYWFSSFKSSTWGFRAHKLASWHKGKMLQKVTPLNLCSHIRESSPGRRSKTVSSKAREIKRTVCPQTPREAECQWDCQGHLPLYLRWAPGLQYPRPAPLKHKEVVLFQETIEISWSHRMHLFCLLMASHLEHQGSLDRWSQKGPPS